jgi:hypothetical protein
MVASRRVDGRLLNVEFVAEESMTRFCSRFTSILEAVEEGKNVLGVRLRGEDICGSERLLTEVSARTWGRAAADTRARLYWLVREGGVYVD